MKIAVDAMGGDNAPEATIKGSIEALNDFKDLHIIITGPEELLNKKLSKYSYDKNRLEIVNASEIITNNEHPVMAIRKKKDSSLYKALSLVKKKEAEAVISAGSTGAFMAGSLFVVGRIKGVDRPAIAPILPGKNNPFMLIDAGANAECKPHNLLQFALMGSVYFENILNVKNPSVGLVNIGEEEEKGNTLTKSAFKLLKDSDLNFIGNVEPREVPMGDANILVCDGFVGNTILKMYEGVAGAIFSTLKEEIMSSTRTKIGGALLKPAFKNFKKKFDYKEYGGAVFLGVKGICVKAHGSSDYLAIKNAIKQSIKYHESDVVNKIKNKMEQIDNNIDSEK